MNPGELSVRNNRVVFVAMLLILVGGFVAYQQMGRLEDPEFTIKEALIITPYPGASAEEVAKEVTNPIESACQQLGQLDRVESESSRGMSVVCARSSRTGSTRTRSRRCGTSCVARSPTSKRSCRPRCAARSMVIDDFGDVYGIFLAITGDGYSSAELRRYAEFLRRELLLVQGVKKVDLFGEQQEVVFLEISRQRLAQLGINEEQIYGQLQARNVAADGGRVRVGDEHIALDPHGGFALGRGHARSGDRLGPDGPPALPPRRRDDRRAAIRTRRAGCCATTASRPSASASPRCRAATS